MARETGAQRRARQTKNVNKTKTKQVKSKTDGKVYTVTSTDGGKTWGNKTPFTGNLLAARLGVSQHGKTNNKTSKKTTGKNTIESSNRKIHGDKKIDALKIKHSEWKKARKEGTMDAWNKKYKKNKSKFSSSWD